MKKILLYLILIIAVGMAGTVAYVSVNGLLKVFAGAGAVGLIFFCAIEAAKIVATSAIHTYGKRIGWFYNFILSLFIVIAMAITSMGIYGFLSSSYKETFSKLENMDAQIELLEKKRDGYQGQLDVINTEKESVTNTITELSKGLSNNVIQYRDPETGEIITTTSSATRRALEKQLDRAVERQEVLNEKSDDLSTKVFDIENEIMSVKLGDDASTELGPLKYLADVTGLTMDDVMKYFIILLIVIGDPMAVIMVIVFNKVVNYGKVEDESVKEKVGFFKKIKNKLTPKPKEEEPQPEPKVEVDEDFELIDYDDVLPPTVTEPKFVEVKGETKVMVPEVKEEPKHKPLQNQKPLKAVEIDDKKQISREDIKEIKENERGFSVAIPTRKKPNNNAIDRIGSNKEIRDGKTDKIFFKRR
jgi:hypothetical protein